MPPKKKQTPKNAFWYYMVDLERKEPKKYSNRRELADAAGPIWERMGKEERAPYEKKALMAKNNYTGKKLTSDGDDIENVIQEERREQETVEKMKSNIIDHLNKSSKFIHEEYFHIIHINKFCHWAAANRYIPAEIAILRFNLEHGVHNDNVFHKIIKPGPLPLGYTSDAMLESRESHQLPVPLAGDEDCNIEETFMEMKRFLLENHSARRFPTLYASESTMKVIQSILDDWCSDFEDNRKLFQVYNLEFMFKILKNVSARSDVWHSDTFAAREIEKDVYEYAENIACEFHEGGSIPKYCSRSIVIRQAFIICDNCCSDLKIQMIPGHHLPSDGGNYGPSRAESCSSFSSSSLSLKSDNDDLESVASDASSYKREREISFKGDEGFPTLGKFCENDTSSVKSGRSGLDFAGALGTSGFNPRYRDFTSTLDNLTLNDEDYPAIGQSRGKSSNRRMRSGPKFK